MKYVRKGMSISLVPDKMSLYFEMSNCPLLCKGCHTPELRKDTGFPLTPEKLSEMLRWYAPYTDVIVFLGEGVVSEELTELLRVCKDAGHETCLYTGRLGVAPSVMRYLDYLKTGPYIERCGGLEAEGTNQMFTRLSDNLVMNDKFRR
jgi:anaerobic ribonucleoside-triphosphate reductase activating protein